MLLLRKIAEGRDSFLSMPFLIASGPSTLTAYGTCYTGNGSSGLFYSISTSSQSWLKPAIVCRRLDGSEATQGAPQVEGLTQVKGSIVIVDLWRHGLFTTTRGRLEIHNSSLHSNNQDYTITADDDGGVAI